MQVSIALAGVSCGAHPPGSAPQSDAGPSLNLPTVSCPEAGAFAADDAGACVVGEPREFSRDIAPLFNSCGGEVCHDFSGGGISRQIGVPSQECCNQLQMIEPGHPERSYVLIKLLGQNLCGGSPMPLDKPSFGIADRQAIADWICQGADSSH
jgi:hypothetical protein